ncbi:MAG: NAD-glutamate dehydrogenase [Magnetococcales bacterium]|nr:NAD-glutamate dehydrogenase [Magnetococcales bacterium]
MNNAPLTPSIAQSSATKELENRLLEQVSPQEQPLLDFFVHRIKDDLRISPNVGHDGWCDPTGLLALFRFFQKPLEKNLIKVQVDPHELDAKQTPQNCIHHAVRISVHLRDTPFILETLHNYLRQSRLTLFAQAHSSFVVERDQSGTLCELQVGGDDQCDREMILLILTEPITEPGRLEKLRHDLSAVLTSVKLSVDDFPSFSQTMYDEADRLESLKKLEESRFLHWILENNFVFMGLCTYQGQAGKVQLKPNSNALGVFRNKRANELLDRIMPGMRLEVETILGALTLGSDEEDQSNGETLTIEYCMHGESIIYASEGVDFFAIRKPQTDPKGEQGAPCEFILVLGRFSRAALASRSSIIPVLSRRLQETLALSGYPAGTYLHHEFTSLYDRMPLRELFYSRPKVITEQIKRILTIQGDIDVRVDARLGRHGNYVSILTVLSRNRYQASLNSALIQRLSEHLEHPISTITISEAGPSFFIVCYANHTPNTPFQFDHLEVERTVSDLVMNWEDKLRDQLLQSCSQSAALERFGAYTPLFDPIYKQATDAKQASKDIECLERLRDRHLRFTSRISHQGDGPTHIHIYTLEAISLNHVVQTFNHLGICCLHEFSSHVLLPEIGKVRMQRFEIGGDQEEKSRLYARASLVGAVLEEIQLERLHDDELNQLVLCEGFAPQEIFLVRGLRQYLLQINRNLSETVINRVLVQQHALARIILDGFKTRFDPVIKQRKKRLKALNASFEEQLSKVVSLQDDQVIRQLFNVVNACVRTNYFKHSSLATLALKINSRKILSMPDPRPWREVFVLGAKMEGIHLRGGKVARGGLRFSDRPEDYRTEVLGLMKTQMVKNAIITPMGAKGGFVIPGFSQVAPEARKSLAAREYRNFIRALLDITDNRVQGRVVPPQNTMIHDKPDPYLVVAADKGTAAFSDLANQVAQEEFNFWLGDAFASGGSHGYDHKKVGITARGAWACIRLHFLEMGKDVDAKPFTVIGIGDMAGDVFGNGMLASPNIILVGAFNHRHIFLDPNPDPYVSFEERQRLFRLERSTWQDYNSALISSGGGVFERTAKRIALSVEMRKKLHVSAAYMSGEQLIQTLLKAPVDLLYNGGIGAYVKGSEESHLSVSDKANDAVRVNGQEVRAKIIGEGGNLGITQIGRIEYALHGGRINTDALDNSGGVDLSDHEVNLKMFFDQLMQAGEIASMEERNTLLERLTDEVAGQVLDDNRMQHQAMSRDERLSERHPEYFLEGLGILRDRAALDYESEAIPGRELLASMLEAGRMPRPILAIMIGYAKMFTFKELMQSDVVDLFFSERYLADYFPVSVSRDFAQHLSDHFLHREIIATAITNRVINQTGVGLFLGLYHKLLEAVPDREPMPLLIKSYLIAENLLDAPTFRDQVQSLGSVASSDVQHQLLTDLEKVLLHLAAWMINHLDQDRITIDLITIYSKVIASFRANLWDALPRLTAAQRMESLERKRKDLVKQGLPDALAKEAVAIPFLRDAMNILNIKESLLTDFQTVGHLYIQVDDFFGLSWIDEQLQLIRSRDVWGRINQENIRQELWHTRTSMVKQIITFRRHNESVEEAFEHYLLEVAIENDAYKELLNEVRRTPQNEVSILPLSVLVRKLSDLLLRRDSGGMQRHRA